MELEHTDGPDPDFRCPDCDLGFLDNSKANGTEDASFLCGGCGKAFKVERYFIPTYSVNRA